MTRRAISPPPGSVLVPRIASHRAPTDMTPTVAPPPKLNGVTRELTGARRTLVACADDLRAALRAMGCDPLELTSVLAAIDHVIGEEKKR